MPKFTDQLFRKIFMGLVTLAVMLVFILSMHMFMGVPLGSRALWSGSILTYLSINLIFDIRGITRKIIVLGASIIVMGAFFNAVINLALVPSLFTGMIIMTLSILLYMTFLH